MSERRSWRVASYDFKGGKCWFRLHRCVLLFHHYSFFQTFRLKNGWTNIQWRRVLFLALCMYLFMYVFHFWHYVVKRKLAFSGPRWGRSGKWMICSNTGWATASSPAKSACTRSPSTWIGEKSPWYFFWGAIKKLQASVSYWKELSSIHFICGKNSHRIGYILLPLFRDIFLCIWTRIQLHERMITMAFVLFEFNVLCACRGTCCRLPCPSPSQVTKEVSRQFLLIEIVKRFTKFFTFSERHSWIPCDSNFILFYFF